ncbi:MAG: CBS domain-containing protein [Deltaproteobacteria bacterium]|nr:MAG: CBS domain-containing protein [Deltaproteobacteria bacterium]
MTLNDLLHMREEKKVSLVRRNMRTIDALKIMKGKACDTAIVVDGVRPVGLATPTALAKFVTDSWYTLESSKVEDWMVHPLQFVDTNETPMSALATLLANDALLLVAIEDNQWRGIITKEELLQALIRQQGEQLQTSLDASPEQLRSGLTPTISTPPPLPAGTSIQTPAPNVAREPVQEQREEAPSQSQLYSWSHLPF